MSEFILDSGHHYMQTCDECDGAFHTGKRPKHEDQTEAPDFRCQHCQQQAAEIERLKAQARGALAGLVEVGEVLSSDSSESPLAAARRVVAERDALKAEVQRFIEAAAHDQEKMDTLKAERDEARGALVRARNEGIERVAATYDAQAAEARRKEAAYSGRPIAREWARDAAQHEIEAEQIRGLKEPESPQSTRVD